MKYTKATLGENLLRTTRYSQSLIAPGLNLWVYESLAPGVRRVKRAAGCGLEVGVVLAGDLPTESHCGGRRNQGRGRLAGVTTGERYAFLDAKHRQVGFMLHGPLLAELEGPDRELRFRGEGTCDRAFYEFGRAFAASVAAGARPPPETEQQVRDFVGRLFELSRPSAVIAAKKELERYFDCDLPMDLVCLAGGLHRETFCRRFQQDYGVTPAQYRVIYRLNYATRLLWTEPRWSLQRVALESGFANHAYFHRAYLRQYSMTPGQARRRFLAKEALSVNDRSLPPVPLDRLAGAPPTTSATTRCGTRR